MKNYTVRILALIGACVAAVYFMNLIFDIRVRELRSSLKNLNNNQTSFRTLALISRYQLIRDRVGRGDEANQFRHEGKTMLALNQTAGADESERVTAADRVGISLINGLNWLTGAQALRGYQGSNDQRTLELAYLYELRREYAKAAETYTLALRMLSEKNQEAIQYAYLHRGFCLSLLDKKNEALADYSIVISSNQTGEFRYTAEILSALLRELMARSQQIDRMADSEDKAEAYYRLAAYPKALAVYEKLQARGALSARATYYAGRVYEETGQTEKAAASFRSLVATNAGEGWAMRANRRIYALGAFYGADKKYRDESQKNAATVVKDAELVKAAQKFESVIQKNEEAAAARQSEIQEAEQIAREEKEELADKPVAVPVVAAAPQAELPPPPPPAAAALSLPAAPPVERAAAPVAAPPAQPATAEDKLRQALRRENLTRSEKKEVLMSFKELELITLNDDNRIWGISIGEEKDRVSFFTVMGKVRIAKSRIKKREKMDRDEAFR